MAAERPRVLVTGATGFIGGPTLRALSASGYEVCAVSSHPHAGPGWRQADLLNQAAVRELMASVQPTHLLHLAWITTPGIYWTSPDNLTWVGASLELLREFHRHGGRRVVTAGTCAEYDWSTGRCVERSTPLRPSTLYGTAKRALADITEAFATQTGLSAAWGRVFFVYGPHEQAGRLVPSVITALLNGEVAECSAGTQARDFLHVDDLAAAFAALLGSDVTGPVNLASGDPVTVRTVVSTIADYLGASSRVRFGVRSSPPGDPDLLVGDISRLRDEVGWQPRFTLSEGLISTVEWYLRNRDAALPRHAG